MKIYKYSDEQTVLSRCPPDCCGCLGFLWLPKHSATLLLWAIQSRLPKELPKIRRGIIQENHFPQKFSEDRWAQRQPKEHLLNGSQPIHRPHRRWVLSPLPNSHRSQEKHPSHQSKSYPFGWRCWLVIKRYGFSCKEPRCLWLMLGIRSSCRSLKCSLIKEQPNRLSKENQLNDCSWSYENQGCNGGYIVSAFKYVWNKGVNTNEKYPYTAKDQKCAIDGGNVKIVGFITFAGCDSLANVLTGRPISVLLMLRFGLLTKRNFVELR